MCYYVGMKMDINYCIEECILLQLFLGLYLLYNFYHISYSIYIIHLRFYKKGIPMDNQSYIFYFHQFHLLWKTFYHQDIYLHILYCLNTFLYHLFLDIFLRIDNYFQKLDICNLLHYIVLNIFFWPGNNNEIQRLNLNRSLYNFHSHLRICSPDIFLHIHTRLFSIPNYTYLYIFFHFYQNI